MVICGLTGIGICAMHGHVQDALYGNGCCLSCMISLFTLGECGRQVLYASWMYMQMLCALQAVCCLTFACLTAPYPTAILLQKTNRDAGWHFLQRLQHLPRYNDCGVALGTRRRLRRNALWWQDVAETLSK